MRKQLLLTPGPTPIPPEVALAMAKPIIHHRTSEYRAIFEEVIKGLKYVFQTENDCFVFASSGTGAMEAAVVNLLSPKDKVITVQGGKFGERWTEICQSYGIEPSVIDVPWGEAVEPERIAEILEKDLRIKAVFTTLCETSTGVVNDVKKIAQITSKHKAVLVVDAISALASIELRTDAWGIDVVVAGSQKGLMLPPGISFLSISPKAWALVNEAKCPRYYFDLREAKRSLDKMDTPFTPAVTLVIGLREALQMIQKEGLENIWKRHALMAEATRKAVLALGLELFAPHAPSDAVTAVKVPSGLDGENLVKLLRQKYGVSIAGGQAELKGKIFRIAHMGYITPEDILLVISCLEIALNEMGYKVPLGKGVKAAEEVFGKG
ncbi:MAG: alanine--glyoxylate aminotransferase family protein [Candidatus Omnitrophica bacterium]|nr:alanine--glyoxylate aminotransferase family protein [Candidatus Omnitrophota bacterium]MCM8793300.1 alanine--glyoxylate aminotransferase family protein [Candidatus Omnitrophota bacterium]